LTQAKINQVITDSKLNKTAIRTLDILSCPTELLESVEDGGGGLISGLLDLVTKLLGGLLGGLLG